MQKQAATRRGVGLPYRSAEQPPTPGTELLMVSVSTPRRLSLVVAATVALTACDASITEAPRIPLSEAAASVAPQGAAALAQLGARIFNDPNLSLNRNQSCASCHDAAWGFTSPNSNINATGAVMFGTVPTRFGNRKPVEQPAMSAR